MSDIVAAVGLKNVVTGHTLCSAKSPVVLESLEHARARDVVAHASSWISLRHTPTKPHV